MTSTDWIIDIALILIVLRQIREARMDRRFFLLPLGIVAYTATHFLSSLPTAGNDLVLIIACLTIGSSLGLAGGLLTRVRARNGTGYARAGLSAAGLWIASMTARLGFIIWITHPTGGAALGRFSTAHDITGADVWQTALVLLALSEVIVRLATIALRGHHAITASPAATLADNRIFLAA